MLFVAGGPEVMRGSAREHGRAYWTAEFPLVLEKHGWLDVEVAEPEVLGAPANLLGRMVVIVGWLPDDVWRPSYVKTLKGFPGVLMLEGPFPPDVEALLHVRRTGEPVTGLEAPMRFAGEAQRIVERQFGRTFLIGHRSGPDPSLEVSASGEPNPLTLAPRVSRTRASGLSRDAYVLAGAEPLESALGTVATAYALNYRARARGLRRLFDDPLLDALGLLVCIRCGSRAAPGALQDALVDVVREAATRPPVTRHEQNDGEMPSVVWGLAVAEAAIALNDPQLAAPAVRLIKSIGSRRADSTSSRWRSALAFTLAHLALDGVGLPAARVADAFIITAGHEPRPIDVWLDAVRCELQGSQPESANASLRWLRRVAAALTTSSGPRLCRELDGCTTQDLSLVLGALVLTHARPAARRLWRLMADRLYDPRQGLLISGVVSRDELLVGRGVATNPLVPLGLLTAVEAVESREPAPLLRNYDATQLQTWTAAPYVVQPYDLLEGSALVTLDAGDSTQPALWRHGRTIATSFQLLAQLVHVHTVEPLAEPFVDFRSGDTLVLEYLLIALLESALADGDPAVPLVGTWPWGKKTAVTIRHDVDRLLGTAQFDRLLKFERQHELAVSWFWLSDRLDLEQLARLRREPRHEIGLHAVRAEEKEIELAELARAVDAPARGEAIHGAGDGWLGHRTVRAACDANLLYTELAPPVADRPYSRFPIVDADGIVSSEHIIGVTYNVSIEGNLGTRPGSQGGPGTYFQLLNHPDLNFDRLQKWVSWLPRENRLDWTCAEVAAWWRATHTAGALMIERLESSSTGALRLRLSTQEAVSDLELWLPCRSEHVHAVSLNNEAVEWMKLDDGDRDGVSARLSLAPERSHELLISYTARSRDGQT